MSDLIDRSRRMDVACYPDIHLLSEDDAVLWVLHVAHEKLDVHELTAAEVSDVATKAFRRGLSRQRARAILGSSKGYVARSGRTSPARYLLLRPGADRLRAKQVDGIFIDPATSFTGLQRLDQLLASLAGDVLVCDPYVDDKTLVTLTAIPASAKIRLLTKHISDPAQFRRKFAAYGREFGNMEIRVTEQADIHDRYLINASRGWQIGSSLNGIGKKQSLIVPLGADLRAAAERAFSQRWNVASQWK